MSDLQQYMQSLLAKEQVTLTVHKAALLDTFIKEAGNGVALEQIIETQKILMANWAIKSRIDDILQQQVSIPNGTVDKPYEALIDFYTLGWDDVVHHELTGLEAVGLIYDRETAAIQGVPVQSGDLTISFHFRIKGEAENSPLSEKLIALIINPNPKSLWKDIASDKAGPYWKEDNISMAGMVGDKHLVIASTRGRSHATAGSFRDDDVAYRYFEQTGWGIIAVADGAGSAKLSRQGANIACSTVVDYIAENFTGQPVAEFDKMLLNYYADGNESAQKAVSLFVYHTLSKVAYAAHQQLALLAKETGTSLKDFHSTLIFTLLKKYPFGYAVLSFGVGDCPIALLSKDLATVTMMNTLDVGEFGGGTRFITMPEIFTDDKFANRFKFKLVADFAYLVMMTDGIYDPKFEVEANLEKIEKWRAFIDDLEGNNEDHSGVDFNVDNKNIASQLSRWMNFWSAGNHDDRTLAIVF